MLLYNFKIWCKKRWVLFEQKLKKIAKIMKNVMHDKWVSNNNNNKL